MGDVAHLGRVDPLTLGATRVQLHHAALMASAVGRSLVARQPGFRHAALSWARPERALVGWPLARLARQATAGTLRAALTFDPPSLALLGEEGRHEGASPAIPLAGTTFDEAWTRLDAAIRDAGIDADHLSLKTPADLPGGPMTTGEPFSPDSTAAAELGRWFDFADAHLAEAASAHDIALPVPCWADHFDLALVVRLEGPSAPADAQVTLGFSPGDGTIPEPYFYVTPWPITPGRVAGVPAPAGGRWQVEGWVGLALAATAILASADPDGTATTFLARGFEIAGDLVLAG